MHYFMTILILRKNFTILLKPTIGTDEDTFECNKHK